MRGYWNIANTWKLIGPTGIPTISPVCKPTYHLGENYYISRLHFFEPEWRSKHQQGNLCTITDIGELRWSTPR